MALVVGLTVTVPLAPPRGRPKWADVFVADSSRDGVPGTALGSVVVTPDGDLQGASASQALRSRIIRLFGNPPGAYAHIRDWGLRIKRGALARPTDLARYQLQAARLLKSDPDVADARVVLTLSPGNLRRCVLCQVYVRDRFGNVDNFLTPLTEAT